MEIITQKPEDTQKLGKKLATALKGKRGATACSVVLQGDLGSGKTTLVQGFAKGLGITTRLLSPTYIIVRQYEVKQSVFNQFYHIDLYRVAKYIDRTDLGLDEIFANPSNIVVVEWAEYVPNIVKKAQVRISFNVQEAMRRTLSITGPKYIVENL